MKIIDKDILVQLFYEHYIFNELARSGQITVDPEKLAKKFIEAEATVENIPNERKDDLC